MDLVRADAQDPSSSIDVDLFAAAPDGIVVVDESGIITAANDQLGQMFSYAPAGLVGEAIEILLPERFRSGHIGHRKAYFKGPARRPMGATLSLFGRRSTGEE